MANFKPMLSATCEDLTTLRFPVMASPKFDGIRAIKLNGVVVSRNLKPIRNKYVQELYRDVPDGIDGELIVGSPTAPDCFKRTTEGVMSAKGEPNVVWAVFDFVHRLPAMAFEHRLRAASAALRGPHMALVPHRFIGGADQLADYEARRVREGYEGIMIRDPGGPYKFGRSTVKEGYLLKYKRWHHDEATVTGFVEEQFNGNEATTDALGHKKRSQSKAGKRGKGTLGCVGVQDEVRRDV